MDELTEHKQAVAGSLELQQVLGVAPQYPSATYEEIHHAVQYIKDNYALKKPPVPEIICATEQGATEVSRLLLDADLQDRARVRVSPHVPAGNLAVAIMPGDLEILSSGSPPVSILWKPPHWTAPLPPVTAVQYDATVTFTE